MPLFSAFCVENYKGLKHKHDLFGTVFTSGYGGQVSKSAEGERFQLDRDCAPHGGDQQKTATVRNGIEGTLCFETMFFFSFGGKKSISVRLQGKVDLISVWLNMLT